MKKELVGEICISLILFLFAYTSITKLIEHKRFAFQLHLAPVEWMRALSPIISWFVPVIELLIVIGLLFHFSRLVALYGSVFLLVIFEIYIAGMLLSGLDLPCTCGGIISKMSWTEHLSFNAFFIALGITAIILIRNRKLSKKPGTYKDLSRA